MRSGKEAFCLANTDPVDYTLPRANWRPGNTSLASSCGQNTAVAVREVLDIGSGDTYGQFLPGQSFDVTELPNGTYWIEVRANPEGRLADAAQPTTTRCARSTLSGTKTKRKLAVWSVNGIKG